MHCNFAGFYSSIMWHVLILLPQFQESGMDYSAFPQLFKKQGQQA